MYSNRIMPKGPLLRAMLALVLLGSAVAALSGQETEDAKEPFVLFLPVGYDFMRLEEQTTHSPAAGIGFMLGEQDIPFDQVERRFFGMALYQPFFFTKTFQDDLPEQFHTIAAMLDGRIKRHQILTVFSSASDRPVSGGFNTFTIGAGWGYEVVRRPHVSLILGAVLIASDFGITLPSGDLWPILPMPLIRFGVDTKWFASSFDFLTGPNLEFTFAPKERIRLTGEMRMDSYRSLTDLNCEFTLWYRFFSQDHKLGDFAGIGAGFKNETMYFTLSNSCRQDTFELQRSAVFAVIDLSLLKIQGGWVFNSNYLIDEKKTGSPGSGFFLSVQGMLPIVNRQSNY